MCSDWSQDMAPPGPPGLPASRVDSLIPTVYLYICIYVYMYLYIHHHHHHHHHPHPHRHRRYHRYY